MLGIYKSILRICADRSGNFVVLGGFAAVVLAAALGGAVDVAQQYRGRTVLQTAVDAVALAAAKALEEDIDADTDPSVAALGRANLPADLKAIPFVIEVDKAARLVKVRADGAIQPSFLPLLRINSLPISAFAASTIQRKQHTNFYVLVDVSESMNIAASDEDRRKLEQLTARWMAEKGNARRDGGRGERIARPCAFACHVVEPDWADISVFDMNQEELARDPSSAARLRVDVVRDAVKTMIGEVLEENTEANSTWVTKVATAFFSSDFAWGVQEPTDDETALVGSLDAKNQPIDSLHTSFSYALYMFGDELQLQGTGQTEDSPEKFAILVTDGVRDEDVGFGRDGLGPLDAYWCREIKDKGIKLAVLEIKYIAFDDVEGFFRDRVASYYGGISEGLRACASDGLHFVATDADQAAAKLLDIAKVMVPSRHLSQ